MALDNASADLPQTARSLTAEGRCDGHRSAKQWRTNAPAKEAKHVSPDGEVTSSSGCVPRPGRRPAGPFIGLAMVLVLTACGAASRTAGTSTPATEAAATPSPSPDIVSAFIGKASKGLTADAVLTGTVDVGTAHGTMDGSYTFGTGGAYAFEITTRIGESRSVSRGAYVDGTTYVQDGDGPWLNKPSGSTPGAAHGFGEVMAGVASLQDKGLVTIAGKQFHLLQAPGGVPIPASFLGITDPNVHNPHATVDFFAQADGTPAGMSMTMTWAQGAGSAALDGKVVMDLTFTKFGEPITVSPPDDVWRVYTSKQQHFSVAYPGDWHAKGDAASVTFSAPDGSAIMWIGLGVEMQGLDQKSWTSAVVAGSTRELRARSDARLRVDVAGVATSAYQFHGRMRGQTVFLVDVPVARQGKGYELQWIGIPGYERDDLAEFQMLLASFAFTR